jgi:hypothetical protein
MRRMQVLPPLAALLTLAILGPAPARAQQCPYLRQLYTQLQQHQRVTIQYQQLQTHHQTASVWQSANVRPPTLASNGPTHRHHTPQTSIPVLPTGDPPSRTKYRPHPTGPTHTSSSHVMTHMHVTESSEMVPHTGRCCGPALTSIFTQRHVSVHTHSVVTHQFTPHTTPRRTPPAGPIATTMPGLPTSTTRRPPLEQPRATPGTQTIQQHHTVQNDDTTASRFKVQLVTWQDLSTWSYVRCGRCHQQAPGQLPQPIGHPQMPQLAAPQKPRLNPVADRPQSLPQLVAQKPPLRLFTEKGPPAAVAERPPLKLLTERPQTLPQLVAQRPSLRLFTERSSPSLTAQRQRPAVPSATWLPGRPSLAINAPALETSLPGRLSRKLPPSALDDAIWLPSATADSPGSAAPARADFPSTGLTAADDPSAAPGAALAPPAYPPLPGTGWEPPALAPETTAKSAALPALQRVAEEPTPASAAEPPSLLPLPGANRPWGANDTVSLR